jgi:hypothetical protein
MEYYDVVTKLIGNINPIGKTEVDEVRLKNLKEMTQMLDTLLGDVMDVARFNKDRPEYSMNQCGKHAHSFLCSIGIKDY